MHLPHTLSACLCAPLRRHAAPGPPPGAAGPAPRRGPPASRPPLPPRFRTADEDPAQSAVGSVLSTSSVDEMLRTAHHLIGAAERRIGDYCSTFSPGPPEVAAAAAGAAAAAEPAARRCWHVYRSLHQAARRMEAAAGAEAVTTGRAGPACADVVALERLIRELEYVPVEDMVRVLASNEALLGSLSGRKVKRRGAGGDSGAQPAEAGEAGKESQLGEGGAAAGRPCHGWLAEELKESESGSASSGGEGSSHTENAAGGAAAAATVAGIGGAAPPPAVVQGLDRRQAEAVFASLDRQGRGWLDRDDLLAGLQLLGERLDISDVEQICMELGSCGRVDMQAFCDIAQAERLVVPGSDAVFLRHIRHARPEWWGEAPASLDQSM